MDQKQFLSAMSEIAEEKGIAQDQIIETLEMAIAAAYKKDYGKKGQNIKVKFDTKTGEIHVYQVFLVVDETMLRPIEEGEAEIDELEKDESSFAPTDVGTSEDKKIRFNPYKYMMIDEAKKIKKDAKINDEIQIKLEAHTDFGRIAAQTAKQVIIQRLREAERDVVYNEYKSKEGEVVSAIIQRIEGRNVFMDIGKTSGVLFPEEQVPSERLFIGQRLRVYILKVDKAAKGPVIILSRVYPKLVSRLFAIEVPEISTGAVQIKSIAREPGSRTKIAVYSEEEGVDPIGSCVGQKGSRVQTVISELGGEKIDIIEWNEDIVKYIANALSPAKVLDVEIDEKIRIATAIVPEDQLSLAIGQQGQNVRLAAKLTGWKVDIKGEKAIQEEKSSKKEVPTAVPIQIGTEVGKKTKKEEVVLTEVKKKPEKAKKTKKSKKDLSSETLVKEDEKKDDDKKS